MLAARRVVQRQVPLGCRSYVVRPPSKTRDPLRDGSLEQITPELTFIHRPPPTAPSPYSLTSAPSSPLLRPPSASSVSNTPIFDADLPPALPKTPQPTPRLGADEIAEIQRLRAEDPATNTRLKLARQFGCNPVFISMVAPLPKDKYEEVQRIKADKAARWSESKTTIKALRRARKEYW